MIETGRYRIPKIEINERFCRFCSNKVESEVHFLLHCHKYVDVRDTNIHNQLRALKVKQHSQNEPKTVINLLNPQNLLSARDMSYTGKSLERIAFVNL